MILTREQQNIVHHGTGHARVSAVAGSGKTTTMVARLGYLLEQGVAAEQILVLMFNRSARDSFARTMQAHLGGQEQKLPEVRTFHSLGLRLVNSFTRRGALPSYQLVTREYLTERLARQVAGQVYKEQGMVEDGYLSNEDIEEFLGFIDRVKSTLSDASQVYKELDFPAKLSFFPQAYTLFEETRKKQRLRFYADLIHEPLTAMRNDPELAAWVTNRVDHIIVDEYQDINETQQQLLKILAGSRAQVMVVGDVDQCIYEWRGARPEYITSRFAEDFSEPRQYQLSYTFRYGHQLSLAANHLISNNRLRDQKHCVSHTGNRASQIVSVEHGPDQPVAGFIQQWLREGRSLGEAAVLVRLYAQSVPVELALLEAGIPYRLEGGSDVFDCNEIHALLGYLRIVLGEMDMLPGESRQKMLHAMLCQPHLGISREEIAGLAEDIGSNFSLAPEIFLRWSSNDYPAFIKKRFVEAADNWRWLMSCSAMDDAAIFLRRLIGQFKLYEFYHSFAARAATAENRVKTCEAFIEFAKVHKLTNKQLLEKIEELRGDKQLTAGPADDTLLITSVHRAKGLEWPLVILPGLEEGSFPFLRERQGSEEFEDERRLFYVAITRAMERLICLHPQDARLKRARAKNSGQVPSKTIRASRFLYEANLGLSCRIAQLLENDQQQAGSIRSDTLTVARQYLKSVGKKLAMVEEKKRAIKVSPVTERDESAHLRIDEITRGMAVFHPSLGPGIVCAIKDKRQGRLMVDFEEHGVMTLLAAYAKLEPCDPV
jgi:DNA helicase-2/ATP-dependent DNA helicase PcrA